MQIVVDSCCAIFAGVQKGVRDFWDEFQLYAADLLVGIVVDATLVGMLAPYVRIGKPSVASGGFKKSLVLPICRLLLCRYFDIIGFFFLIKIVSNCTFSFV